MGQIEATTNGDVAIDDRTALIFPEEAPLTPGPGLRDARAVWTWTPERPDGSALIYLHGNNNYVTVDARGKPRVPDWATDGPAQAGAAGKPAAPLIYELDKIPAKRTGRSPLVLVPEVATHATGAFWAREPAGQYADPARLGRMVEGCQRHLAMLPRPGSKGTYLSSPVPLGRLGRVCLTGHSGAGLPMEEAARSSLMLPASGVPADLWLLDCTYWSKVDGFVEFCARWASAGRLRTGDRGAARMVCIYQPGTGTEGVADDLRRQVARSLGVTADSLVQDHSVGTDEAAMRRQLLTANGVLFLRTHVPHDQIPTLFIPQLLATTGTA